MSTPIPLVRCDTCGQELFNPLPEMHGSRCTVRSGPHREWRCTGTRVLVFFDDDDADLIAASLGHPGTRPSVAGVVMP